MRTCFLKHSHFDVVGAASCAEEALEILADSHPHVLIIDMATRQSLDLVRRMRVHEPDVLMVGFGVDEIVGEIVACAEAGLAGYVPSEASLDELVDRVECVCRGELVCSPKVAAGLFRSLAGLRDRNAPGDTISDLTPRERQVLKLVDDGFSNKGIANSLGIEVSTVKNHVHNLLEKLKVSSRMQAAARLGGHLSSRYRSYLPLTEQHSD